MLAGYSSDRNLAVQQGRRQQDVPRAVPATDDIEMSDDRAKDLEWISEWIEQQRERLRTGAHTAAEGASAQQWFAAGTRWLELFDTWRAQAGAAAGSEAQQQFADLFGRLPPLGLARPQIEGWRELEAARREYEKLERALRDALLRVQADALALLERRVRERASDTPIQDFRELYDLWIECGEHVYAQVAHSDEYCRLLAEVGNATMRVRAREQALLEQVLRYFDLPTRSELNTVHRQMRELRSKVAQLEAALAQQAGARSHD